MCSRVACLHILKSGLIVIRRRRAFCTSTTNSQISSFIVVRRIAGPNITYGPNDQPTKNLPEDAGRAEVQRSTKIYLSRVGDNRSGHVYVLGISGARTLYFVLFNTV